MRKVLLTLALVLLGRLIVSYPLNTNLLEGTDFTAHIPKIWYLVHAYDRFGDWNPFWYGGYEFLRFYSPLSYFFTAFFAYIFDESIAYKLVMNIFFLLSVIVFLILLREFKLNENQQIIGLLVYGFFITNLYYFWNNAYPSVINMTFCALVWIWMKRFVESNNMENFCFASVFIGLSILIHQLTAFLNLILLVFWILLAYRKIPWMPILFGFLISGFWLFPFLLEFQKPLFKSPEISAFLQNIEYHLGTFGIISFLIFSITFFIFGLISKHSNKQLFFTLLLAFTFIIFTTHNRILAVLPIPLAIWVAKLYRDTKLHKIIFFGFIVILISIFYSYHPFAFFGHERWEVPEAKDRVIFLPSSHDFCENEKCKKFSYSVYLAPKNEIQVISGWFQESQKVFEREKTKWVYLRNLSNPLELNDAEYLSLLREGFVNSVIVNKFFKEYVDYFEKSKYFEKINETKHFIVFEPKMNFSYVEINGKQVNTKVERKKNKILIEFNCFPGNVKIKESHSPFFELLLNGKPVKFSQNNFGFIEFENLETGKCRVELLYKPNRDFLVVSILSILFLCGMCIRRK
jgi:hypothetical protein